MNANEIVCDKIWILWNCLYIHNACLLYIAERMLISQTWSSRLCSYIQVILAILFFILYFLGAINSKNISLRQCWIQSLTTATFSYSIVVLLRTCFWKFLSAYICYHLVMDSPCHMFCLLASLEMLEIIILQALLGHCAVFVTRAVVT